MTVGRSCAAASSTSPPRRRARLASTDSRRSRSARLQRAEKKRAPPKRGSRWPVTELLPALFVLAASGWGLRRTRAVLVGLVAAALAGRRPARGRAALVLLSRLGVARAFPLGRSLVRRRVFLRACRTLAVRAAVIRLLGVALALVWRLASRALLL